MKRWYRIGICLFLSVCLLLLSSCKGDPITASSNPTQTAEQNTENLSPQNQFTENTNLGIAQLVWTAKSFDTFAAPKSTYSQDRALHRLTYDSWQETAASIEETHRSCSHYGYCSYNPNIQCEVVDYLKNTNHSKEYFAEKTLLVIRLQLDVNNSATLKDIRYADGLLTCLVELEKPIRRIVNCHQTVYVQIETALPEDTELKLEITNKDQTESEIVLNWKDSFLPLGGNWKLWEKDAPKIASLLTYETYQKLVAECAKRGSTVPAYPKEFFDDHSLIVLGLASGSGSTIYEIYDLHYTQGTLTCIVDSPHFSGMLSTANMASYFCFIEVDAVLPEDTEIILDVGSVECDYNAHMQKIDQFNQKCYP